MSYPSVVSVNIAQPRLLEDKPRLVSAIDKLPAPGPVTVENLGLKGDAVGNPRHHGGTYRAVYAYAQEDLAWWSQELGQQLRPGFFGENLTTEGIDLNSCVIGEQWLIGTARFQVSAVRTPRDTFERWIGLSGLDNQDWVERFVRRGRPGVYLAILDRGWVQAGDPLDVVDVPEHGLTAAAMFRAITTEPSLLPLLLEVDGLPAELYELAQDYVDRRRT